MCITTPVSLAMQCSSTWPVSVVSPAPFASLLHPISLRKTKYGMTRNMSMVHSVVPQTGNQGTYIPETHPTLHCIRCFRERISTAILWNDWERGDLKRTQVHAQCVQSVCCKRNTLRVRNSSKVQSKGFRWGAWWPFQDHGQVPGKNSCTP